MAAVTARIITSPSRPAHSRLGHAGVITPDLERFRRFYEDVLGLRLAIVDAVSELPCRRLGAFTDRDGAAIVILALEMPGYRSGLSDDVLGRRGRIDHIAFSAADNEFDEIVGRLVDAGASSGVVTPLGPVRSVRFVDPDGAHHHLLDPVWRPDATADMADADVATTPPSSVR